MFHFQLNDYFFLLKEHWLLLVFIGLVLLTFLTASLRVKMIVGALNKEIKAVYQEFIHLRSQTLGKKSHRNLFATKNEIQAQVKLKKRIDQFDTLLLKSRCFSPLAEIFRASLDNGKKAESRQVVNSEMNRCIRYDHIAQSHVPEKSFDHAQQIIVSLGVLGTIIGLVIGLNTAAGGLISSDPLEFKQGLSLLINGVGMAFITLLIALFFGHWFHHIRCKHQARLEKSINQLRQAFSVVLSQADSLTHPSSHMSQKIPKLFNKLALQREVSSINNTHEAG